MTVDANTTKPFHVRAGEGKSVWVVGEPYTFLATAETTGGQLTLFEGTVPPGGGPPPHIHHNEDEGWYVLSGEVRVYAGDEVFDAKPGDFVYVPRGTVHRFTNPGIHTARLLVVFTPAGFEGFLIGSGQPARAGEVPPPLGAEEIARSEELAGRYGIEVVDWQQPGA